MRNLIWIFYFTAIHIAAAQDTSSVNTIQVNWGAATLQRQDLLVSPFIQNDISIGNIGLHYIRDAKYYQEISLAYRTYQTINGKSFDYFGTDSTLQSTYPHYHTFVNLNYAFGKIIQQSGQTAWLAGGSFVAEVNASNLNYGRNGTFAYFASFGFSIWGAVQYAISDKQQLQLTLTLPLFAWIARSPYLLNDDTYIENTYSHSGFKTFFAYLADGRFATWNTLQGFTFNAQYMYAISNKWEIGGRYDGYLLHYSDPVDLASVENIFSFSLGFKL